MPSNLASRHNTRRHTSIQGRDNKVDRGQGSRLSLLRNMTRDRSSSGKSCNSLRSLLPRTGLKAEEAAESLALAAVRSFPSPPLSIVDQQPVGGRRKLARKRASRSGSQRSTDSLLIHA